MNDVLTLNEIIGWLNSIYIFPKGISGEEFAKTVCVGQTQNYLSKAVSLHYDVNSTIKNAVEDIAKGRLQ